MVVMTLMIALIEDHPYPQCQSSSSSSKWHCEDDDENAASDDDDDDDDIDDDDDDDEVEIGLKMGSQPQLEQHNCCTWPT